VLDLIGLVVTFTPRVYATRESNYLKRVFSEIRRESEDDRDVRVKALHLPDLPITKSADKKWNVRALDDFEQQGLALLQQGHAFVMKIEDGRFRGLGAIRMQTTCRKCHDDKNDGDLLGAFTSFGFTSNLSAELIKEREELRTLAPLELKSKELCEKVIPRIHPENGDEARHYKLLDQYLSENGIITYRMLQRQQDVRATLPKKPVP
jgi:hypothetical protein